IHALSVPAGCRSLPGARRSRSPRADLEDPPSADESRGRRALLRSRGGREDRQGPRPLRRHDLRVRHRTLKPADKSPAPAPALGRAATRPGPRGPGLYAALLARGLADARADGGTAAVIQADRATSAPICAKLGFRELCGLEMFAAISEAS